MWVLSVGAGAAKTRFRKCCSDLDLSCYEATKAIFHRRNVSLGKPAIHQIIVLPLASCQTNLFSVRTQKPRCHGFKLMIFLMETAVWQVHEQVAIAAMDVRSMDLAFSLVQAVRRRFPDSARAERLTVTSHILCCDAHPLCIEAFCLPVRKALMQISNHSCLLSTGTVPDPIHCATSPFAGPSLITEPYFLEHTLQSVKRHIQLWQSQ